MAKRLQHRGGTTSQHSSFTGAVREVTVDTDKNTLVVHDGATAGGHPLATATNFTSTGIEDNATSTAITIHSNENVSFAGNISTGNNGVLSILDSSGDISGKLANQSSSAHSLEIIADPNNSGANSNMMFKIDNSEKVRITSAGNVGIGTSSPSEKLDIRVDGSNLGNKRILSLGTTDTAGSGETGIYLGALRTTSPSRGALIAASHNYAASNNCGLKFYTTSGGTDATNLSLRIDGSTQYFYISGSEKMRLNSTGLGIGTTSPTGILECKSLGNTQVYITAGNSSASELFFGDEADVDVGKVTYLHSSNAMKFQTNTNEAMRIDSSGNVGIGLTNPTAKLHVNTNSTGRSNVYFSNMNTSGGISSQEVAIGFQFNRTGGGINVSGARIVAGKEREWVGAASNQDGFLAFETCLNESVSEKMRIDSSGNLLVGKTSANTGTAGVEASPLGRIGATRSGNITGLFNRLSSDGEIVRFQKDGTTVGSIGAESGSLSVRRPTGTNGLIQTFGQPTHGIVGAIGNSSVDFYITNNYSGSTDRAGLIFTNNNKVAPAENASYSDNVTDLGSTTARFKDLYLGGGVHLGGTGSANKLDDYEEGEWTPSFSEGTGTTTASSTHTYTKIGRVVVLNGYIYNSSGATSGNDVQINGLPFTASSSRGEWKGSTTFHAVTFDTSAIITPIINGGQNYIRYTESRSGTSQDKLTYGDAGTGHFQFSITYITDA